MLTSPSSLAMRKVVQPGDGRGAGGRLPRAGTDRVERKAVVGVDGCGPEGVERPVLQQHVHARPMAQAPAARVPAACSLSSVPEKSTRERVSSIGIHHLAGAANGGYRMAERRRQVAEPGQAAQEDGPHQPAGGEDLVVGQLVADDPSVAMGLHQPDRSHRGEMLGGRGLR